MHTMNLHHTHVTKAHFGTGAEKLSITIFLPLNHTIMLKCLGLLTFYLKIIKFKLSLKRFLKAISVIYVVLELIRIMNRELSCQLTDLIFGWDQSDYATGNHIFYLLFIQFLKKTARMSFDVSSKIHTHKKYFTLSCSNHFYFHSSHWI